MQDLEFINTPQTGESAETYLGRIAVAMRGPSSRGIASSACFTSANQSASPDFVTLAPTTGQKLVITDLVVSVANSQTVTFTEETTDTVFLTLYMAANSTVTVSPRALFKLNTINKRLQVQSSAAGKISVLAFYRSQV